MQEWLSTIVFDDNNEELSTFVNSLGAYGIPCIPVLVKGAADFEKSCQNCRDRNVRIIVTDIQMFSTGTSPDNSDYSAIASAIETIYESDSIPYILMAWTSKPEYFDALQKYLNDALSNQPRLMIPISKSDHRSPSGAFDLAKIYQTVMDFLSKDAEFKALLAWERKVSLAAHETVNEIFSLSPAKAKETLMHLAKAVAGKNLDGYEGIAVNEALQYILKDKLSYLAMEADYNEIWRQAFSGITFERIDENLSANLNTLLHIESQHLTDLICPGDFWSIESGKKEDEFFKIFADTQTKNKFLEEFFLYADEYAGIDASIRTMEDGMPRVLLKAELASYTNVMKEIKRSCSLGILEISPQCDFAQKKKDIKTFVLCLYVPTEKINAAQKWVKLKNRSESLILYNFHLDGEPCKVMCSSKYLITFSIEKLKSIQGISKKFRMRESLLQEWIHKINSYNSRVGTISF